MKIIIARGRCVTDYKVVISAMVCSGYWKLHKREIEVICGMARGADALGMEFAKRNGLLIHEFHADWDSNGRAAGHIRNAEMGKFALANNGKLLALWDGKSRGTEGMISWAVKNGLEHFVFRTN